MYFKSQPMSCTMGIIISIAPFSYIITGCRIHIFTGDTSFCRRTAAPLSFFYNAIYFLMFFSGFSHNRGTGHICMITTVFCGSINYNEVPFFKFPIRRNCMGQGPIGSSGYNRWVRFSFCIVSIFGNHDIRYLFFSITWPQHRKNFFINFICYFNCGTNCS